jgi:hypothetical protein
MKTINHEVYVSLEIAKLLKELGFDWPTRYSYDLYLYSTEGEKRVIDGFASTFCNEHNGLASMPTLDVAQRWLREEKLYNVLVDTGGYKNYEYFIDYHGVKEGPNYPFHEYNHNLICNTYEEALEAGIKKTLELILGEGE